VDDLIRLVEAYGREHQAAIRGPKPPGFRLRADRVLSA
jgi:hypothetical protein